MSNIKKTLILALLFVPGFALAESEPKSEANVPTIEEKVKLDLASAQPVVLTEPVKQETPKAPTPPPPPAPVIHEVQEGDTLSGIAETHETVWTKIYDANAEIGNPDLIHPGEKLKVPKPDEQVASRSLPAPPAPPAPAPVASVAPVAHASVAPVPAPVKAAPVYHAPAAPELVGSYGYVKGGSNCVNTAKAYGKNQPGNPINRSPSTQAPFVGAAALFHFNHVGIVAGVHSNGDIEVIHENCPGCPSRYPRSSFRGFF